MGEPCSRSSSAADSRRWADGRSSRAQARVIGELGAAALPQEVDVHPFGGFLSGFEEVGQRAFEAEQDVAGLHLAALAVGRLDLQ
jgi:hypothetical protein